MKEIADIYKLSPDEFEKKKKNLWDDTAPEIKDFAEGLYKYIKKVDTPYVIALDGGYGTGKTHFATRFNEFLNDNNITSQYFSVWESDYIPDPFITIMELIILIVNDNKGPKVNIFKKIGKATKTRMTFGIPGIASLSMEVDGDKLIKELFPKGQIRRNIFIEAKIAISDFIKKLPNQKMVLIIDELDRCSPDYAVKTLETIKHFFDIEGLIIILPVGIERLKEYINGFYGVNGSSGKEDYFQKFINYKMDIPELNYVKICEVFIEKSSFKSKDIDITGNGFNSLEELKKWIAQYSKNIILSYRETREVIRTAIYFSNHYVEPIRCRLLAYKLCDKLYNEKTGKHIKSGNDYIYDKDFSNKNAKDKLLDKNNFEKIFRFSRPTNETNGIVNEIRSKLNSYQDVISYDQADEILNYLKDALKKLERQDFVKYGLRVYEDHDIFFKDVLENIDAKLKELSEIKNKFGSDDNDDTRFLDYEEKIKHPTRLFK